MIISYWRSSTARYETTFYTNNQPVIVDNQLYFTPAGYDYNVVIDNEYTNISSSLLDNQLSYGFTGYVGNFLEFVQIETNQINAQGDPINANVMNHLPYYGSEFPNYSNGGLYNCVIDQPNSLAVATLSIYADDIYSPAKDGFCSLPSTAAF